MSEEPFLKPIIVSIDDIGTFEQKEMKNISPIKNTWYDLLINYIPKSIGKSVRFKDKVISLKIWLWEYNLYKNKNNLEPHMISENRSCKIIALLKSLLN